MQPKWKPRAKEDAREVAQRSGKQDLWVQFLVPHGLLSSSQTLLGMVQKRGWISNPVITKRRYKYVLDAC